MSEAESLKMTAKDGQALLDLCQLLENMEVKFLKGKSTADGSVSSVLNKSSCDEKCDGKTDKGGKGIEVVKHDNKPQGRKVKKKASKKEKGLEDSPTKGSHAAIVENGMPSLPSDNETTEYATAGGSRVPAGLVQISVTVKSTTADEEGVPESAEPKKISEKMEKVTGKVKSKAELKRERREKQEAQRAAKMAAQNATREKSGSVQKTQDTGKGQQKMSSAEGDVKSQVKKVKPSSIQVSKTDITSRRIPLLGHLKHMSSDQKSFPVNCRDVHPSIRSLGLKMKARVIDGCNARVIATLVALRQLVADYHTPASCDLSRDLADRLTPNVKYLSDCRPTPFPMDNAIRFVKREINSIEATVPEAQAKEKLIAAIDEYLETNINLASRTITDEAASMIEDGDVILTYGYSAVVGDVFLTALKHGKKISVVVVDVPQPASGAAMLPGLAAEGISTHYRLLPDLPHIIHKVNKVIVEAEAVMLNGAVLGQCGLAGLALVAVQHNAPVIVVSHTYKFCNIDLTDSLVINELGDSDAVVKCPSETYSGLLSGWQDKRWLDVVSLVYDVMPSSLITALVTEHSVLPTSAVPVIIKRNYADILGQD